MQSFDRAQEIQCEIQHREQSNSLLCQGSPLVDRWIQQAHLELQRIYQKKREEWSKQSTQESLADLENNVLREVYLNYAALFLQESFSISDLEKLIRDFDELQLEKNQASSIKEVHEYLQISVEDLKSDRPLEARFFLLAGFSQINALIKDSKKTPVSILTRALSQAHRSLQSFYLFLMMPEASSKREQIHTVLKKQQQDVVVLAAPFISAVLKEQNRLFRNPKDSSFRCQKSPWDQAVPLFDNGYQLAKSADKELGLDSLNIQEIEIKQEQTVKDWEEALQLLLIPPKQEQDNSSTSQNIINMFQSFKKCTRKTNPRQHKSVRSCIHGKTVLDFLLLDGHRDFGGSAYHRRFHRFDEKSSAFPLAGTITITHGKEEKVDAQSFKIEGKPLQVSFVKDVKMSASGDSIVSIYEFELPAQDQGLYVLPAISVKIDNQVYRTVSSTYAV